jgi:putative transposase
MDQLVKTLGNRLTAEVPGITHGRRPRRHRRGLPPPPLDQAGPFTVVAADALTMKVREGGRLINALVLLATGVNGDGHREVLGMRVATSETGSAWNEFFADLVARGLTRRLITDTPSGSLT